MPERAQEKDKIISNLTVTGAKERQRRSQGIDEISGKLTMQNSMDSLIDSKSVINGQKVARKSRWIWSTKRRDWDGRKLSWDGRRIIYI